MLYNSGALTAEHWLERVYPPAIAEAHRNADLHIHDLSMLAGYRAGWSLGQLIREGLGGVENRISSRPARHLSTLVNQMVNFLGVMQNEWAGAQALSVKREFVASLIERDFLPYMKRYLKHLNNHFSTIGICGMNECTLNFLGHDKARFSQIITAGELDPYYTNSTHLPVDFTPDLFDALDHQEALQVLHTGGDRRPRNFD